MIVGILSDTHGYFDPKLRDHFRDVEAILHAGDVGSARVLKDLQEYFGTQGSLWRWATLFLLPFHQRWERYNPEPRTGEPCQ